MTSADIVAAARSAIGAPFVHQGRNLSGMDCVGLGVHVASLLGIPHEDETGYARRPSNGLLEAAFDRQEALERIVDLSSIAEGDILVMRFGRDPQHMAIYTGDTIIHAYSAVGKVCEHRLSLAWRQRIVRAYRFRGIT